MTTKRRWMKSAIATAAAADVLFPWARRKATLKPVHMPVKATRLAVPKGGFPTKLAAR